MKIISLTGTQDIVGGSNHFSMVVEASGEAYSIPIGFDTYQLLNELAVVSREEPPISHPIETAPVFSPPDVGATPLDWENPTDQQATPIDQLAKIGLFEPRNVLDAVQSQEYSDADELMAVLEDTSDDDDEDDPGEMNIDDGVSQYQGD